MKHNFFIFLTTTSCTFSKFWDFPITAHVGLGVRLGDMRYRYHRSSRRVQGLRASSLQFTSPLEFNAIFRDGFTLRLDLTAGSKIRDPVTAKFKHARLL